MPSVQPDDPGYRRLRYIRYADDHLLGFTGPKAEAEEIKQRLAQFLREDLKLELAADKTLITHARTGAARFLGYEITVQHNDTKTTRGRRSVNGTIGLRVPRTVITAKCAQYCKRGKPARRTRLMNATDYAIIRTYGSEYQGLVQYYLLAGDVFRLNRLRRVMELSMLKTLGSKHRTTARRVAARYKAATDTPYGPRRCLQATLERDGRKPLVARFGGIPLKRQKQAILTDRQQTRGVHPCSELITRLLHGRCELCQATDRIQVHHVGALADLATPDPHPRGRRSWHNGDARPSWSAEPATTASTRDSRPHARNSHRRAGCGDNPPVRFGGRPRGKGPAQQQAPRRVAHPTPGLHAQLAGLPWRQIPVMDRTRDHGHGRVEVRTLKVAAVAGLCFPHAAQAIQVIRRVRMPGSRRWRTVTVYSVTSLTLGIASPAQLAGWLRGHWRIENRLHWVRDVTFSEEASHARTCSLPRVMASLPVD
jgi:hypothetical protein